MSEGFDLLGSLGGPRGSGQEPRDAEQEQPRCSRKGCRERARWALLWNNPRLHTPERRKIWTACDEHREWLADYLRTRALLRDVVPLEQLRGANDTED